MDKFEEYKLEIFTMIICTIALVIIIIIAKYTSTTNEFIYKGHQYIEFGKGVVHNPECKKCLEIYD